MSAGFVVYSELVGKLLANVQALEFLLRAYLYARSDPPFTPLRCMLNDLQLGDDAPVNPFTDWSSLSQLITRYNTRVAEGDPNLVVDLSVVDLRDALAHSRVWLPENDSPPLLLKFDRPRSGITRVALKQVASREWLESELRRVAGAIDKVEVARRAA